MAVRVRNIRIARQFADLTDLEKVQAAEAVAETMESPGWEFIVQVLEGRRQALLDDLVAQEVVRSQAEYAARLGEARGIGAALDVGQTVRSVGERSMRALSESEGTV